MALENYDNGVARFSSGAAHVIDYSAARRHGATSVVSMISGGHDSYAVPAVGPYRIDPDMDIFIKHSDASALFGAELTADTDAYSTTAASLAAQTGLDVGTADFSMEFWLELDADTPNGGRPFGWGLASGGVQVQPYYAESGGYLYVGLQLNNAAGTTFKSGAMINTGLIFADLGLSHYVITVDRAAGSGTGTVTYIVNDVQVATQTYTEDATPANLSASGITGGTARIVVGGTLGANAEWDGRIEDIKVYSGVLLTLEQIQARTNAGPLRNAAVPLDLADLLLTWWVNFQQASSWANPLYPECVASYGNAVFNSPIGSPAVTERSGGAAATTADSYKIYAGKPEKIFCDQSYLSIFTQSLSAGDVRITPV